MVDDSDIGLFTDASGHGWGAFYGSQNRWICGSWSPEEVNSTIEFKELFALVAACRTWGHNWSRKRIRVHCDNSAVVDCVRSGTSRAPPVMDLLRTLFVVCSLFNFTVSVVHVAGTPNPVADALSRFRMQEFRRLAPAAWHVPDTLPPLPSNRTLWQRWLSTARPQSHRPADGPTLPAKGGTSCSATPATGPRSPQMT